MIVDGVIAGWVRRSGSGSVDFVALEAPVTWAGAFAPKALGILVQEVAVPAAVAGAVGASVEDAVVMVAGDVSWLVEVRVRCRVFRVVAMAWLMDLVLGRRRGRCLGFAVA
jgi:hypothetical protein